MRRVRRRHRALFPIFSVTALLALPAVAWSDQAAEGKTSETEAQEMAEMAADAKVTIHDAIKAATQRVQGTIIEAELEKKPRATWEVEVLTADGKIMEVWVDVDTGAVVAAEEKKPEKATQNERQRECGRHRMGGMMHSGCGSPGGGGGQERHGSH